MAIKLNRGNRVPIYKALQDLWIQQLDVQVGDEMVVVLVADTFESDLNLYAITDRENISISEYATVLSIAEDGVEITWSESGESYTMKVAFWYLEPTGHKGDIVVKEITSDYDAIVTNGEEIIVGCQTISFDMFDSIAKAVETVRLRKSEQK